MTYDDNYWILVFMALFSLTEIDLNWTKNMFF